MSDEFDTPIVVDKIFKFLEDEGLLREAHPFALKVARIGVSGFIENELWNLPNSFDVGYDEGYKEGKDRGYEDGAHYVKSKIYDFVEDHEELEEKITAFLEDMEL